MNQNLLKNFDLMKSKNLLDDPKNEKYFGKKDNMVSVDKPYTSKPLHELIKEQKTLDKTIFVGGFNNISRVPFWMRTYQKDRGIALRTFEKKSIEGERHRYYTSMYFPQKDEPVSGVSRGTDKETREDLLPEEFGMNHRIDEVKYHFVIHRTFWDNDFGCFLWFYTKHIKERKMAA